MKKVLICILIVFAAIAVFFIAKPMGDGDLDGLGGEPWELVGLVKDGKKIPQQQWEGIAILFEGDKITWLLPGEKGMDGFKAPFTIDASKKPKEMQVVHLLAKEPAPAIYKIEEGALFLCVGAGRRPTEFTTKGTTLYVFKRG